MLGTIRKLKTTGGYGFVQPQGEPGMDSSHFFHWTHVEGGAFEDLRSGDTVEFESLKLERGFEARHLRRIERLTKDCNKHGS